MKFKLIVLLQIALVFSSCSKNVNSKHIILKDGHLNSEIFRDLEKEELILLSGYLYVYGNECDGSSDKIKCKLLKKLKIDDECNKQHIKTLKKWFKNDVIMSLKLQKCPVLPVKFAIQNKIEKIIINRENDTISITIKVIGMNVAQEKHWNIEQTYRYLINNNSFIKLKN